jgi:protein involved in polysaccharide export with SLBB domain
MRTWTPRIFAAMILLLSMVFAFAQTPTVGNRIIKPGDSVRISCEEEPSINKTYTVTSDGLVILPFIGAISIGGKTEIDAALEVSGQLVDQRILRKATVSVVLEASTTAPVSFSGAVKANGEVPFAEGLRLHDVLKIAEPSVSADLTRVEITNSEGKKSQIAFVADPNAGYEVNPLMRPGDKVFVPMVTRAAEVTVLGGVRRPGIIRFQGAGLTLRQAVDAAGGVDVNGDARRVRLERAGTPASVIDLQANAAEMALQAGDRIVVELLSTRASVAVVGAVVRPGAIEYREGMTLTQALADAGGVIDPAKTERVAVYAKTDTGMQKPVIYNLDRIMRGFAGDVALQPGDRVEAMKPGARRPDGLKIFIAAAALLILFGR